MSGDAKQVNMSRPIYLPVWSWGALCVAVLVFAGLCWAEYAVQWNSLQRYYVPVYLKTGLRAWQSAHNAANYEVVHVLDKRSQSRLAIPDEIEVMPQEDGTLRYRLNDVAAERGLVKAELDEARYGDQWLHGQLAHWIYQDGTLAGYLGWPAGIALAVFAVLLYFAGPLDRKSAISQLRGQRLKGTEQLTPAGFNRRMQRRTEVAGPLQDGVLFLDAARSWLGRQLNNHGALGVYVPREREQQHIVMMGDTGAGKSSAIRQALWQAEERGELGIVYDVSGELTAQFYDPARGDVILNPLDARCPFYALAEEIEDDAEALTVAESLFPDRPHDNPFFVEATRSLFAYLLCLQPTPDELVYWLSHPSEIDKRVRGTELETTLAGDAPGQRKGVLASLNAVAKALRLLPKESEVKGRFSTKAWAARRKGWIFITSTSETRAALRPLVSLWLDLLVSRLLSTGAASGKKTWLVLDELHSLQRLTHLPMALTEGRRADCVMVLGFQGRAQIVDLYGPLAETLLSQPATKLFFRTSDPDAAAWISRAIGEAEYLRHRVSTSQDQKGRATASHQREIVRELLLMGSEIMGLEPLECYVRHGNYVIHLRTQYTEREPQQPAFLSLKRVSVRARLEDRRTQPTSSASTPSVPPTAPKSSTQHQQEFFE